MRRSMSAKRAIPRRSAGSFQTARSPPHRWAARSKAGPGRWPPATARSSRRIAWSQAPATSGRRTATSSPLIAEVRRRGLGRGYRRAGRARRGGGGRPGGAAGGCGAAWGCAVRRWGGGRRCGGGRRQGRARGRRQSRGARTGHQRPVLGRQRHERGAIGRVDVAHRAARVAPRLGVDVSDRSRRREDESHAVGETFDPLIVSQLGDASPQLLVLRRQGRGLLERAAHARARLQDLDLGGDDARQQDAEQRNPRPAPDDPVQPGVVRQGDDERAHAPPEPDPPASVRSRRTVPIRRAGALPRCGERERDRGRAGGRSHGQEGSGGRAEGGGAGAGSTGGAGFGGGAGGAGSRGRAGFRGGAGCRGCPRGAGNPRRRIRFCADRTRHSPGRSRGTCRPRRSWRAGRGSLRAGRGSVRAGAASRCAAALRAAWVSAPGLTAWRPRACGRRAGGPTSSAGSPRSRRTLG